MNKPTFDAMAAQYALEEAKGEGNVQWKDGAHCVVPEVLIGGKAEQVQYTGKNLFDLERRTERTFVNSNWSNTSTRDFDENSFYRGLTGNGYYAPSTISNLSISQPNNVLSFDTTRNGYGIGISLRVTPGQVYVAQSEGTAQIAFGVYDENGAYLTWSGNSEMSIITIPDGGFWMTVIVRGVVGSVSAQNIQIELGTAATEYEPYTGGIPAPNPNYPIEPVFSEGTRVRATNDAGFDGGEAVAPELLAIPGTEYRDEWDAQTGRGVRRIGHLQLTGDEIWYKNADFGEYRSFYLDKASNGDPNYSDYGKGLCNIFPSAPWGIIINSEGNYFWAATASIGFRIHQSFLGDGYEDLTDDSARISRFKAFVQERFESGDHIEIWWVTGGYPFQTGPQPLVQPKGDCNLIQTDGTLDNCPIDARYVTHS